MLAHPYPTPPSPHQPGAGKPTKTPAHTPHTPHKIPRQQEGQAASLLGGGVTGGSRVVEGGAPGVGRSDLRQSSKPRRRCPARQPDTREACRVGVCWSRVGGVAGGSRLVEGGAPSLRHQLRGGVAPDLATGKEIADGGKSERLLAVPGEPTGDGCSRRSHGNWGDSHNRRCDSREPCRVRPVSGFDERAQFASERSPAMAMKGGRKDR